MERTIEPPDPVADDVVGETADAPERRRVHRAAAGADAEGDRKPVSRQDGPDVSAFGGSRGPAAEEPEEPEEPAGSGENTEEPAARSERGETAEDGTSVDAEDPDPAASPDSARSADAAKASATAEAAEPAEVSDPAGASGSAKGPDSPKASDAEQTKQAEQSGRDESGEEPAEVAAGPGRRRIAVLVSVAAFAYALDLISKIIVVTKLEHEPPIDVIGDLLRFHAVRNPGAAFGIGEALTVVFTVIAVAVIVVIARIARKLRSTPWAVALGMLLGGAFGNLTDRIFRSPGVFEGHVVDFIAPAHFAVFNLADSAIVCGGILIVILSFRGIDPDGTVHRD